MKIIEHNINEGLGWSTLISSVQKSRDKRARYFKPTCLFAVSQLMDEGTINASKIDIEPVIERFEVLVSPVLPSAALRGWMPFWHLTNDIAWNCYKNDILVKKDAFPSQGKPKSKGQLLAAIDYASVPQSMLKLWLRLRVSI